ncbi:MAG: protein-ADP-ribose hydrolase [Oscillospiraceae bacterium]|nr:protein-ADP-ribose hydrolase [Oscillospiraceae bacterium]
MTQSERRIFLINRLIAEQNEYSHISIPTNEAEQKNLLRSLMNVRMPKPVNDEFLRIQDEYLRAEIAEKGITDIADLEPIKDRIYLWQGDITTLKCGAIVNAANSRMLGCFVPCHKCIDNAIHTYAGVQLRAECEQLMQKQDYDEPTGKAKITKAYNLPCSYVIHTVGPIVSGNLTKTDCDLLTSCYRSCLETAERNNIKSIAFCCISTGEFHFPNDKAAEIAVNTVSEYLKNSDIEKVIFNVFKDIDYEIYRELLGTSK